MDLIAFDPDRTTGDGEVGVPNSLACPHIELPTVPRAFHYRIDNPALSERPSRMGTAIVYSEKRSADVEQGDPHPLDLYGPSGSWRNVFDLGDGDEWNGRL